MNTIEEGAIVHEKQRHNDVDVEKGKSNGQGSCDAGKLFKDPYSSSSYLTIRLDICAKGETDLPPLKGLSFLDRFLVLWILIAMGVGIAIGNTVESAGPALHKGEFVGVSIPIGKSCSLLSICCYSPVV